MEKIQITLFVDGDRTLLEIPAGTTVGELANFHSGLNGQAAVAVGGRPANKETRLQGGDRVQAIPESGRAG